MIELEKREMDAKYQEALRLYKQGTYEGYQKAYELFLTLGGLRGQRGLSDQSEGFEGYTYPQTDGYADS